MSDVSTRARVVRSCRQFFAVAGMLVLPWTAVLTQDREQMRAQAEAALRTMSPQEIDRRIREMGMTPDEAATRARAFGLSIEDYLGRVSRTQADGLDTVISSGRSDLPAVQSVYQVAPKETLNLRQFPVPGFSTRVGSSHLSAFGYHVFQLPASTFEPAMNLSAPPSYVLGPGDELVLLMWGETRLNLTLRVNRDGNATVPDVGPVPATGSTIDQFKDRLIRRMTSVYASLKNGAADATSFMDVSLSRLRTVQVFVLGEVVRPGGYTVSSMSTVLHALYLAGGATVSGSLREVRAVRNGKVIASVDLYEYLVRGDRVRDVHLQDGDVVFVPFAGPRAAISGKVQRPAIYELKTGEALAQLLSFAGGLRFDASPKRAHVQRTVPLRDRAAYDREVLDLDLTFEALSELERSSFRLEDGDLVTFDDEGDRPAQVVSIRGAITSPGRYQWKDGMRVRDLIMAADSLQRGTFGQRATVLRLLQNLRQEMLSFDPLEALNGNARHNVLLRNEDEVWLYYESSFFPQQLVSVAGSVRMPGHYRRYEGMTVADLVVAAGGLTEDASRTEWELSSIETTKVGSYVTTRKLKADSAYWNSTNDGAIRLRDLDHLIVPADPFRGRQRMVALLGMVMYPGQYSIRFQGERLVDIVKRAGGIRDGAYLEGSRFSRARNAAGHVPVDFRAALSDPTSKQNIELFDGDTIEVAEYDNVVYVRGEVYAPAAVLHQPGASLEYYLSQAGGVTQHAADDDIYVSLPNGRRWEARWWFIPDPEILAGSTVQVPRKIESKDETLPILRDTAAILASMAALAVAIIQVTK